jgi:hypothetical protein
LRLDSDVATKASADKLAVVQAQATAIGVELTGTGELAEGFKKFLQILLRNAGPVVLDAHSEENLAVPLRELCLDKDKSLLLGHELACV